MSPQENPSFRMLELLVVPDRDVDRVTLEAGSDGLVILLAEGVPRSAASVTAQAGSTSIDLGELRSIARPLERRTVRQPGSDSDFELFFANLGGLIVEGDSFSFVPIATPGANAAEARDALLADPSALAFRPLPGPGETIREYFQVGTCPGPPPHEVRVPLDNPICPQHGLPVRF
jgi:hypothetical protein